MFMMGRNMLCPGTQAQSEPAPLSWRVRSQQQASCTSHARQAR